MMKEKKTVEHLIWTNNLDFDDWKDDLAAQYPDMDNDQLLDIMYELNNDYLDDERINLDIQLDTNILVIAKLGLWRGVRSGYKEISTGNIKDCLYSNSDYVEWSVDAKGDLVCKADHHDGTNYLLYRAWKPDVTQAQIDSLLSKIYADDYNRSDITKYTYRLGDHIANMYGWDLPKRGAPKQYCA